MFISMFIFLFFYASGPDTKHENLYPEYQLILNEQKVTRILETLRKIESNGNYKAQGLSGEYGAYQFTLASWNHWCMKTIGYVIDIKIPENQDVIAEQKVRYLLFNDGLSVDQVASFWNSGCIHYAGRIGRNRHGIKYNVPKYVTNFIRTYENT